MSETTEKGVEKPEINLIDALRVTFDPKYSTLGHGTQIETANKSLKEGLQARFNNLGSTTVPLFDSSKPYEEQIDDVIRTLLEWPHYHLPAITIIMLPNPEENEPGGFGYFDNYFEELLGEDTGYNNRFVIPARYVKGYVNVEQKVFIENPDFNPTKKSLPPFYKSPDRPTYRVGKGTVGISQTSKANGSETNDSDKDVW